MRWCWIARLLPIVVLVWGLGTLPGRADDNAPESSSLSSPARIPASSPESILPVSASSGLTLAALEQMALECNPTLAQAATSIRAAEGSYVQEGLYPNPTAGDIGDEIGNNGTAGFQGAFVRQEIVTAGKLRLGRAVASHEIQQARYIWEVQRMRVLNDVRAQFSTVLLVQKVIEVNEQLVRISEENLRQTEQLQKAQEVGMASVLEAQVEMETAKVSLATAKNRHWSAWRQLAAVVGRPDLEPAQLQGNCEELLPLLSWEAVRKRLLTQSPMLAQARARVERARCELARQYALRVPNVELETAVKHDSSSGYTVADVQIGVPLPIHNRNQGNILRAQAQLLAAEKEVQRLELALQQELANVYEQYLTAHQQAEAYAERILPNARKSLELMEDGVRQGEFGYLDLLTAQRTYFTANRTYLTNLQELITLRVTLEGLLLRGGLEEPLPGAGPLE